MAAEGQQENKQHQSPAIEHITGAQKRLKSLRERVGEHPELTEAIRDLELALSILTVKTSGLL